MFTDRNLVLGFVAGQQSGYAVFVVSIVAIVAIFAVDARKISGQIPSMRNGEMRKKKRDWIRTALIKTNVNWADAALILGMSETGVASFAKREKLVRRGRKFGEKRWVLA